MQSVSSSVGRVLTWTPLGRSGINPLLVGDSAQSSASSSSTNEAESKVDGTWTVCGQCVCVVDSRLLLTATHVCFDGSAHLRLRVVFTSPTEMAFYPAKLIRYSGSVDVAVLLLEPPDGSASLFQPVALASANSPPLDYFERAELVCYPLVRELYAHMKDEAQLGMSDLLRLPASYPAGLQDVMPQVRHTTKGTRRFSVALSSCETFKGCSGGAVFARHQYRGPSGSYEPLLLGVHIEAITQSAASEVRIAAELEFDGVEVLSEEEKRQEEVKEQERKRQRLAPHTPTRSRSSDATGNSTPTSTEPAEVKSVEDRLQALEAEIENKAKSAVCVVADTALSQRNWSASALRNTVRTEYAKSGSAESLEPDFVMCVRKSGGRAKQSARLAAREALARKRDPLYD